jgi:hypothetical protein
MDVIINEVVSTVRLVDSQALLDERTLSAIVRAVVAAVDDKSAREQRRDDEMRVDDDGRGGLAGAAGRR